MLRTAFAVFGRPPFEDLPPSRYRGQAVWTEVSLCASKILHDHAHGRCDEADQAFLTCHLANCEPVRVWQGNVLAHLIALHALRTFEPGGLLTVNGIEAVAAIRPCDGGVPFVTSQDVFGTALAGIALVAGGGPPQLIARMADWVAAQQLPDGGWGYSTDTSQTDVDDASRCIHFLHLANPARYRQVVENGYAYLAGMAGPDGGFPTYVRGHASDIDMTAEAITALSSARSRHAGLIESSAGYLVGHSEDHGSYPAQLDRERVQRDRPCAGRAGPGARPGSCRPARDAQQRPSPVPGPERDGGWGQTRGEPSDVLSTAQAVPAVIGRAPGPLTDRAVRWLLAEQHDDGGFTSRPDQVGPRPLPYDFPVLASIHALNALNAARESAPARRPGRAHALALTAGSPGSPESPDTRKSGESGGTGRQLPAFYCPFPPVAHPLAAQADARSVDFMHRCGLRAGDAERARLARAGCGDLAGRECPAAREGLLQVMADYNIWAFAFDDEYCGEGPLRERPGELADAAARMQRCAEVPEHTVYPGDRYGASLREMRSRLAQYATPLEADRFADLMRGYFAAEVRKAGFVARGQRPGLDDYTLVRLYSGGSMAFAELVAVCNGCPAPAPARRPAGPGDPRGGRHPDRLGDRRHLLREGDRADRGRLQPHRRGLPGDRLRGGRGVRAGNGHVGPDDDALPAPARPAHGRAAAARGLRGRSWPVHPRRAGLVAGDRPLRLPRRPRRHPGVHPGRLARHPPRHLHRPAADPVDRLVVAIRPGRRRRQPGLAAPPHRPPHRPQHRRRAHRTAGPLTTPSAWPARHAHGLSSPAGGTSIRRRRARRRRRRR